MFANAQKKKLSNVYFLFRFLWKSLPTTTAAQHLLFLSKRSHKKLVWEQMGSCFFLFVSSFAKNKRVLRDKLLCFVLLNKNIVRFEPRTRVQVFRRSWNCLCFFASGNKKNFYCFAFSQLGNKKRRSAFWQQVWTYREKKLPWDFREVAKVVF